MTDKQIIIDGVDVNDCHNKTFYKNDEGDVQCKCYRFEDADSDTLLFGICKQHPHCYYKQLKRKEQECEELKIYIESNEQQVKEVETLVMDNDRLINELDQLKVENDNIKETFDGLFKVQYKLADNNKKLRQCLTEIKEIAEHCINQDICTFCDNSDKCYIEDEEIPTYDVCKLVLQKISECEGNDE